MTAPTLVITGASGFVGTHLARLAAEDGYRVWAVGREAEPPATLAASCDRYFGADLAEGWPIDDPVDAVVHLAGLAAVGPSFAEPQRYIEVNSGIMTAMCEALLRADHPCKVVVVSSGSVYEPAESEPIGEDAPTIPTSPYAVAKLLVESQARYYSRRGLDTLVARPFNHIGPGQSRGFLVPDITSALRGLAPGEPLRVGNLDTARDYTDVRDVARAYLALVAAPQHRSFVYNICSGRSRSGREILASVADALGRPVPSTEVDSTRLRPGDPMCIIGSAASLRNEFGWAPRIDVATSIRDYVVELGAG
ncbi:MAG: NAD-dependent epimerase/dehydratase family protein [Microbacterium sp.]